MGEQNVVPPKVMEQIYSEHGKNYGEWNQELQDLFDPTISARQLNPPLSGKIEVRKNTNFQYRWAKDVCGSNPDHTRVEELRAVGWEFADTNDVKMANDFTVRNRNKNNGFSNEIRNGDLRLMKIPMQRWREMRKSENVAAFQMAYPQAFGTTGRKMSTENLAHPLQSMDQQHPGMRNKLVTGASDLADFENNLSNPVTLQVPKGD
jgi:hypothetical protein